MLTAIWRPFLIVLALLFLATPIPAQTLLNVDFGVGEKSAKTGFAATGQATNDFWNLYHHYAPKFVPGMPLVADGMLENLKLADGSDSKISMAVTNAPNVWGNASGDAMFDTFIFAQNSSNLTATVSGLEPGRYHFYLYGHADADVTGEQNSVFTLRTGTNTFGPLTPLGAPGWKASASWQERYQYVVFRDVPVTAGTPLVIEVAPGPNNVAVLNGLQIISRGTSPPRLVATASASVGSANTNLIFRSIAYTGHVTDTEARFTVNFEAESFATNEISAPLFEGDVALLAAKLPDALRIVSSAGKSRLFCATPGNYAVSLDLVAKITRAEPWNQINFIGPVAPIASVKAEAAEAGIEMQLLSGTQLDPEKKGTSRVSGFLSADRVLNLRWQSKTAEVTRRSLVTVDTTATAQVTPTVIKFTTALTYEILQAAVPRLAIELPASHTLTRLQGEQIRDWKIMPGTNNTALLNVEFIKPVEKNYTITLFSEQPVETTPQTATLVPPQPLEVERESGSFTLSADDAQVEIESAPGLRQVNAPAGSLAAYRFNARPFSVSAKLRRVEPVLKLADRATVRVEESRLLVNHALTLNVEKAGIYTLELTTPPGLTVADVRGEGVDDWKAADGKLKLSFAARVLGTRKLGVQLERAHKQFPESVTILPLAVTGATNVTTEVGAASSPGIRLKTQELDGLREVPVNTLQPRSDELLAFTGEGAEWKLILATEKLSPRIVSEIFNLVTVGDGLVGGSATIRFGIINQGVQEFRVALPAHWKNVEFTGANIRRKEQSPGDSNSVVWTLTLQDKAWGGYTLVVTYDYQFDAKAAALNLAGAHTLGVERETGSLGIMTAASLKLEPAAPADPLHRVDESELSETDRSLCTRPLLLAYKYVGTNYQHTIRVTRFEELPVLAAVADRTELISVITEEGQMLTQASFMVKNNEMQAQRFMLPPKSELWSTFVNGQPAKPERDGDDILVSLPRDANRDQAFSVDIVYKQSVDLKSSLFPRRLELKAPLTDVPNTYAEWALFVPMNKRLSGFDGNMTVARGTTYGLRDAWQECLQFYWGLVERNVGIIIFFLAVGVLAALIIAAARRGMKRAIEIMAVLAVIAILAAMLLPALSKAKSKAQRISAVNNLKQVGLAARIWSGDKGDRMPASFEDMKAELGTDKVTIDPNTGQRFVWVGAGKDASDPGAILAYSPSDQNGRAVLLADGSVQQVNSEKFSEMLVRDEVNQRMRQVQQPAKDDGTMANKPTAPAEGVDGMAVDQPQSATVRMGGRSIPTRRSGGAKLQNDTSTIVERHQHQFRAGGAKLQNDTSTIDATTRLPGVSPPTAFGLNTPAKPTAAGVRPIRIDVPRSGHQFNFTKVLNIKREPLSISASVMPLKTWRGLQMILQVVMFVVGLVMLWRFWSAPQRSSFWLTVAIALMISGVVSLFAMWRVLGAAFIVLVPMLLLIAIAYCVWQFRHRRKQSPPPEPPLMDGPSATTVATLLVLLGILTSTAPVRAQDNATSTNSVSLVSASYTGRVQDKVAQFEATYLISSAVTNQSLPLFNDDIVVQSFTSTGGVKLVREGRRVSVFLPARGTSTLQMKLLCKLGGDVTKRSLAFTIPPALSSQVNVTIDEAEADVEFPTAVSFRRTASNGQTSVSAILGATDRFEMTWTPRIKRAADIAATVFCQTTALATFSGGVTKLRTTLEYQVTQGELKQLRVRLPGGQRLLRVEGASMRTWELKPDVAGEILSVDLLKGVSPGYKLTLETERVLDKLPATVDVEIPHALDVKRETGLVALSGGEELALTIERSAELQRVDAEEFARAAGITKEGLLSAFRFLRADFNLAVRVEAVQPQIEVTIRNDFRIGFEQLSLVAQVNYAVKKAGVFALRFALPDGWRLDSVSGTNMQQWAERGDAGTRVLEVSLKERTLGTGQLQVTLSQNWKDVPPTLSLAGVAPLGTQKLSGYVTVTSEIGIGVKTASFDGLVEVPYASVGTTAGSATQGSALAFKLIATDAAAVGWKLSVTTESVEAWVRAEVFNAFTFTETLVNARALVKFDIANAPVKEFRVRVPMGAKNVEITGVNIRRRDQQTNEWRVELQNKVRGDYVLTVTWEWLKDSRTNLFELTGVEALGVERESGSLVVVSRPPLQVTEKSAGELLNKIDVVELPAWTGRAPESTVFAYRYVRPGYRLFVEARRYAEAEVLQALVDSARFTTVVSDDGQTMTEASLSVRNNGRQHLEIELPKGSTVWSAFVAGEPVRPSKRGDRLLLPLERTSASDAPITVELTYVGENKFPRRNGNVALASPKFDVPLKNARWDVFLPSDYEYTDFKGSMTRTADAGAPTVQDFSRSLYSEAETSKVVEQRKAMKEELSNVKQQLAEGKVREAIGNYSKAKKPAGASGYFYEAGEIDQLAKDVKRIQGSNLVNAQNAWFFENNARFNSGSIDGLNVPPQQQAVQTDADADVAGKQWEKLEAAQQLAVAKVTPLHVNLPTRGVRYSFTQVLQTEINKPMTIGLFAENTKTPSWLGRFALSATAFVLLWVLMSVVARRRD
ncbi:MAG: type II secretion system protein [Verrucomicrobiota bacterium]